MEHTLKIIVFSFLLLICVNKMNAQTICSISEQEMAYRIENCLLGYSGTRLEAANQKAIDDILKTIGITNANFVTKSCRNINNALAYYDIYQQIRYILIDEKFVYNLNPQNYKWSSVFVLAHEIAHHLSGHTVILTTDNNKKRQNELDCDKFAGFVIRKLGGSIENLKKVVISIPHAKDNTGSHPTLENRLASAIAGYNMGIEEEKSILNKYSKVLEEYFEKKLYEKSISLAREHFYDYLSSNEKSKLEESLNYYLKILGESSSNINVYVEIASVYALLLDYHNAEKYLKIAYSIKKQPEYLIDIYDYCLQYHIMNQEYISKPCNQYSKDLRKINYKSITNLESLKKLARFYSENKDYYQAEQILNFAVEIAGDIDTFPKLSELKIGSYLILVLSDIFSDLSIVQLRQSKYQIAYTNILKSLKLSNFTKDRRNISYDIGERADKYNNIVLLSNKAVLENRLGMWELSNKTYSEMGSIPRDMISRIFFTKGDNYYNLGEYSLAIKNYDIAIKHEQDEELLARYYYGRGMSKYKSGDIRGACSDFLVSSDKGDVLGNKAYKALCE